MIRTLWLWLPDEAAILVIAGIGLALILGLLRARAAASLLAIVLLTLALGPFAEALFEALPGWLSIFILVGLGLALLRGMVSLLLGERATDHMVGILAADVVRLLVGLLFLPFRLVFWIARRA